MSRPYRQLVILITTECDLGCKHCCYRMGFTRDRRHFAVEEITQHAHLFTGLKTIYISGGEPTLHPNLLEVIRTVRERMEPKTICLATHGLHIKSQLDAVREVDWVMLSGVSGGAANKSAIKQAHPGVRVTVEPVDHREVPTGRQRPGAKPCTRQNNPVYVDGRLYPCCVAYGIPNSEWITPSSGWQQELRAVPLPCEWCGFSK